MLNKFLILFVFGIALTGIITGTVAVSAQETYSIPPWIKNTAGWWSEGVISDGEFVDALQFLIDDGILQIQNDDSFSRKITDSVLLTTDKNVYQMDEDVIIHYDVLDKSIRSSFFLYAIYDEDDNIVFGVSPYAHQFSYAHQGTYNSGYKRTDVWDQTFDVIDHTSSPNGLKTGDQVKPGKYKIITSFNIDPEYNSLRPEYILEHIFYIHD